MQQLFVSVGNGHAKQYKLRSTFLLASGEKLSSHFSDLEFFSNTLCFSNVEIGCTEFLSPHGFCSKENVA